MAAPGERGAGGTAEEAFLTFYSEVKQIEKRDSVLTPKNQIERLTRPGSSYFNLNPFEVLQMDPDVTDEEIKKRFRQLSILVHPDKNQDDAERAQKAFEAVDKAYKLLLDQEQKKRALDVIQAGKEYVEHTVKEKKKLLKKEGKPTNVEEDDPEVFKQAVYKQTMKLFAELEIKRKEREAKEMHERKRQREEEIEAQEKAKREREWQKNFERLCCSTIFMYSFVRVELNKMLEMVPGIFPGLVLLSESNFGKISTSQGSFASLTRVGGVGGLEPNLELCS
ncbi:dnaJ homolog subfamily C member 8 isoform X1 [Chrysemys picta bellii]|uniref:dnaJ homolog subfamily C member 8 isoform X1 n=1 Tax=Chrysemys picta bellii TaxID=8478 RepID=UPI0032B16643